MPQKGRFFYFDFFDVFFVGLNALKSRYNNSQQVYAINADNAVIKPRNKPSENIANKIIAANRTIVSPKFFANTLISFSKKFIFFPFVWLIALYHILQEKYRKKRPQMICGLGYKEGFSINNL